MITDPKNELTFTSVVSAQSKNANFTVTGIDLSQYLGQVALIINVGTTSGTNPTLDVALSSGDANDGSNAVAFSPAVAAVQFTAAGQQILTFDKRSAGRYLKIAGTIGGTNTPTATVSMTLVAGKRVQP